MSQAPSSGRGPRRRRDGPVDDDTPKTLKRLTVLVRLVTLLRPHRARFALASVTLLLGSGLNLIFPQAAKQAVDLGMGDGSLTKLNLIAMGLVVVFLLSGLLTWARHYLMSWLGERVVADLRAQVFGRMVQMPVGWFHERPTGELTGRLAADVSVIQGVVGSELSISLRELVTLVGGLTLLFIENAKLTMIMLGIVPPIIAVVMLFGRRIQKMSEVVSDELAGTSAQVQETVGAIQTVQSFRREAREAGVYAARVDRTFSAAVRLAAWRGLFIGSMTFFGWVGIAAIVYFGGREIIAGTLTAGDLAAFLLYTSMVAVALGSLASLWGSLQAAAGATTRLFAILDGDPAIKDPPAPLDLPPQGQGHVRFERVSFRYPKRSAMGAVVDGTAKAPTPGKSLPEGDEQHALADLDVDIAPGQVVAFVGRSGAGKSTLASLLMRFWDPTSGRIQLDGIDLKDLRLNDLRGRMAIVSQEPVLFSGTLADNISYGRPGASAAELEAAARAAHAHEFIVALPDGYATVIGERGVKLSGGQRQRVAIARALLLDPRVLILDEATSNLDGESESLVQDALTRLMVGRTTLVIAHRLSTIAGADRIIVLDKGRVVESGSHDVLMSKHGLYRKLVEHQLVFGDAAAA